jgi:tyrosine-protein kinase Etk/Wzc
MILKSRTLIGKTLDELPFDIEYHKHSLINKLTLYPYSPIKIIPEDNDSLPRDIEFTFKFLGNNKFSVDARSKDIFALHTQASFGELIKTPVGNFHINLSSNKESLNFLYNKLNFKFNSRDRLVASYTKRLKVEKASRTGTTVIISLEGTNKTMDIEFLNKMMEIFLNNSLDKKNQEAIRTIQFIDDQLIGISDSLDITENKLQQFRSRNRVMNVSAQGQVIIDHSMSLENEKGRLETEASYYSYLAEYLAKDNVGQAPIARPWAHKAGS